LNFFFILNLIDSFYQSVTSGLYTLTYKKQYQQIEITNKESHRDI